MLVMKMKFPDERIVQAARSVVDGMILGSSNYAATSAELADAASDSRIINENDTSVEIAFRPQQR